MDNRTGIERLAKRIRVPMGFAVAALFLVFARPSGRSLLWSVPLVIAGLWLRAYASGYVRKNAELTSSGPYGYTRNPLYLGSMSIAAGFGVASGSWVLLGVVLLVFLAIYLPTIQGEERYLRAHFATFDEYVRHVPRLLPRLTAAQAMAGAGAFSQALYLQHREYNASMGAAAIYLVLALKLALRLTVPHFGGHPLR